MKVHARITALLLYCVSAMGFAQDNAGLAKELANPVAALISVPFQMNYDRGVGPAGSGHRWTVNIQPVVPAQINPEWNLISRTIAPVISQTGTLPGSGSQTGLGDVVQSFFLSPSKPTASGIIWGAGPVFLLPTGTDGLLSARKWGAGPTAVALRQSGPWTIGVLANHIWSFAGGGPVPVDATFLQPFVTYTTPDAWTFSVNTESTYDWRRSEWSVPLNFNVTKLLRIGTQPVSIGAGVRYWAASTDNSPHGWGFRTTLTFLFPR
jgi:hypothetical protein